MNHNPFRRCLAIVAVTVSTATPTLAHDGAPSHSPTAPDPGIAAKPITNAAFLSWNTPFKPFRVVGNIYYVGASGVSSFLIPTPAGHILIDTGFEMTVPLIRKNITALGYDFRDIKILLSSHAHLDHTGGHALMKRLTGAKIYISEADAALLAAGGTNDFPPDVAEMGYTPAQADHLLRDGDKVELGGATLTCHLTPGHTKGCTTWTMDAVDDGKTVHVVFFGSATILPGVRLLNNPKYPGIARDYETTFRKAKSLPCDVFLANHAGFFQLPEKAERLERGDHPNPFIDPTLYRTFLEKAENTFRTQLEQERKAAAPR